MRVNNKIEVYLNENLKEEQIKAPMYDTATNNNGYLKYTIKIHEQPNKIGIILLDFIQKDLREQFYLISRFYGFTTLLTQDEQNKILTLTPYNTKELEYIIEELYIKYEIELENYKKQVIDIIEYCLFNEEEILKDLTPLERLLIFINSHSVEQYPILKYNKFTKTIKINKDFKLEDKEIIEKIKNKENNRYAIQEIYEIDTFYNLLFLELYFILKEETYLKKCKNCGKYFLTTNPAVIYCDNIYEDKKTCREIGASKVFIKNLENDEAYSLYRKIYKKKQALAKTKGGHFEIEYNFFKYQGKDKKNAYKLGEISKEEFMRWLNNT